MLDTKRFTSNFSRLKNKCVLNGSSSLVLPLLILMFVSHLRLISSLSHPSATCIVSYIARCELPCCQQVPRALFSIASFSLLRCMAPSMAPRALFSHTLLNSIAPPGTIEIYYSRITFCKLPLIYHAITQWRDAPSYNYVVNIVKYIQQEQQQRQ